MNQQGCVDPSIGPWSRQGSFLLCGALAVREEVSSDLVEAKRLEGRGNDEDLLEPSRLYFGSAEFSLSRTERLLIAVREHHRALRQARKLRLQSTDAAASKKD
ncbi:MAG: hypothetical protein A2284_05205 [Deltaproteobacteria bacterium RIFOXYA12_FULL_61_11]|nr:MAG: hypothetical protein A2284_05205 [Deltaproteobacteria bacterium RIFOXYA12_FULL_61_11]